METHLIVLLITIIPFWLLQNIIHELSHGLTLYIGWKWDFKIWPFPSKKLGRFTFAHTEYKRTLKSKEPDNRGWALISIIPKIVNIIFILLCTLFLFLISNNIISILFLIFLYTNSIDFCVGLLSSLRDPNNSDIWKFRDYFQISTNYLKYWCVSISISQIVMVILITIYKLW